MAENPPSCFTTPSVTATIPLRILVADDSRNAAEILAMFFQMEGMETAVALDGVEAVAKAETFNPDLVCLDLQMPEMDGYEAARLIRRKMPSVVLVALSGWDGPKERQRVSDAGFDAHLVKPVKPDDLREILNRHLNWIPSKVSQG